MMPKDKLLHIAAGALTGLSAFLIGWYGLLVVLPVGVIKELRDEYYYVLDKILPQWFPMRSWLVKPGTPDRLDAVATFVGGAVVVAIIMIGRSLWAG